MTQRWLAGYHAAFNQMGFWLSQPGIDVTASGPAANFLLRPDLKYEQIVLSGLVVVGGGLTVNVPFVSDLGKHPCLFFSANIGASNEYPHSLSLVGGTGSAAAEVIIGGGVNTNYVSFTNGNAYPMYVWFMVFNRSVGS